MKKTNYRFVDFLCAGLLAMGASETTASETTRKYRVFSLPNIAPRKCYVGPKAALRVGMTAATSRSFGDPNYKTRLYVTVLTHGRKALGVNDE